MAKHKGDGKDDVRIAASVAKRERRKKRNSPTQGFVTKWEKKWGKDGKDIRRETNETGTTGYLEELP